jgi:hypothetical protein
MDRSRLRASISELLAIATTGAPATMASKIKDLVPEYTPSA